MTVLLIASSLARPPGLHCWFRAAFDGSIDSMDSVIIVAYTVFVGLLAVAGYYIDRAQRAKYARIGNEGIEPTFDEDISFPVLDPDQIERLKGRIDSVCLMRELFYVGKGHRASRYPVFVIDGNGAIHDVGVLYDQEEARAAAKRLAVALEVPFTDESYGG